MKIFLWPRLEKVSNSWHSGGGLLVIADSFERAKELIAAANEKEKSDYFKDDAIEIPSSVEMVFEIVGEHEESVMTFPDAGCC